jgi:hypothetical protein
MCLPDDGQRQRTAPRLDKFGSGFSAAVVHDDDVERRRTDLGSERAKAMIQGRPVVIDSDDHAEERGDDGGIGLRISQRYNGSGTF